MKFQRKNYYNFIEFRRMESSFHGDKHFIIKLFYPLTFYSGVLYYREPLESCERRLLKSQERLLLNKNPQSLKSY